MYQDFVNALKEVENVEFASSVYYKKFRENLSKESVFKYYSLTGDLELNSAKLRNLNENKIYASSRTEFNDPYDDKGYIFNFDVVSNYAKQYGIEWKLPDAYPEFKRICCFTQSGVHSISMWGHYANNHRGYCVEYKLSENFTLSSMLLPVEYVEHKIDLTDMLCRRLDMFNRTKNHKAVEETLLFCSIFLSCIKHSSWRNEEEIRYCCSNEYPGMPYIDAKPANIYIGSSCCKEYEDRLIQISRDLKIPIFKMNLDPETIEYVLSINQL